MKIERNVPFAPTEKVRKKWEFSKMKVKDCATVTDKKEWQAASKAANNYAARQTPPWQMHTQWIPELKLGRIRRLS